MQQSLAQFNLPGIGGVFNTSNLAMYTYVGNVPTSHFDPNGEFNLVGQVGFGAKASWGFEGYIGAYITLPWIDQAPDLGVYGTGGMGWGVDYGLSEQLGFIKGNKEDVGGITYNITGNGTLYGGTVVLDQDGHPAGAMGGPSERVGGGVTVDKTGTFGLSDVGTWIGGKLFDWFGPKLPSNTPIPINPPTQNPQSVPTTPAE